MSVATPAETVVPAGTWAIDGAHSSLEFAVRHLGIATVKGRAGGVTGTITGGDAPALSGTVPVAALTTFDEARDGHLLSPEFFDVERHPELRFDSASIAREGESVRVVGRLTIKGITREIELLGTLAGPETDPWGSRRIGLDLHGTIDRAEFGLRWNAPLPGGGLLLGDSVTLTASFSAVGSA
jgi:polyisoprenoid-binding protein YceI